MEELSCSLPPLDGAVAIEITQRSWVDMFIGISLMLCLKSHESDGRGLLEIFTGV